MLPAIAPFVNQLLERDIQRAFDWRDIVQNCNGRRRVIFRIVGLNATAEEEKKC